jgi:hypothetical protein
LKDEARGVLLAEPLLPNLPKNSPPIPKAPTPPTQAFPLPKKALAHADAKSSLLYTTHGATYKCTPHLLSFFEGLDSYYE